MVKEIAFLFADYIRCQLINNGVLLRLFQRNNPTQTKLAKYAEKIDFKHIDGIVSFKAIENLFRNESIKPSDSTLSFTASLFEITPNNIDDFNNAWLNGSITKNDLQLVVNSQINKNNYETIFPSIEKFSNIIQRLILGFVGREIIFDKIDSFISSNDRGYFYIKGDPGIGKSTFVAKLVNERNYFFHMINAQNNGINTTKDFMSNICSQLIVANNLPREIIPDSFNQNGLYLEKLLQTISINSKKNTQTVIVVDGLDELKNEELTFYRRRNILNLPDWLPKNIYFILTMRNLDDKLEFPSEDNSENFQINSSDKHNKEDIREAVIARIKNAKIKDFFETKGVGVEESIQLLEDKIDGNFNYLKYLLFEIEKGTYKDFSLDEIPKGIESYFQRHWKIMENENSENWNDTLQIISALSCAYSPITIDMIYGYFEIDDKTLVRSIIDKLEQFLQTTEIDGLKGYMFYHKSFLDFINKKEEISTLKKGTYQGFSAKHRREFFD